jgi:hypothetical protein
MNTHRPFLLAARRLRLLAVLAGLAWLLGLHPSMPLRLLVVAVVLDAFADTGTRPARPRVYRPRRTRPGGGR